MLKLLTETSKFEPPEHERKKDEENLVIVFLYYAQTDFQ